ncbi:hypothetical protein P3S68_010659 [Capsicum galapagoense]
MDEKMLPRKNRRIQNLTFMVGSSSIPLANVVHGDVQTHESSSIPSANVVHGDTSSVLEVHGHDKLTDAGENAHEKRKGKRVLKKSEDVVKLEFVQKAKRRKLVGNKRGKKVIDGDDNLVDDGFIPKSEVVVSRDKLIKRLEKLRMELVKDIKLLYAKKM